MSTVSAVPTTTAQLERLAGQMLKLRLFKSRERLEALLAKRRQPRS